MFLNPKVQPVSDFYSQMSVDDLEHINQILHRRGYDGIDGFIARKNAGENCVIDASEGFWDLYELNGRVQDKRFVRW